MSHFLYLAWLLHWWRFYCWQLSYTNEGDIVLDSCAGSGTTAIAAMRTKRNYILIEQEEKYCNIIMKRIQEEIDSQGLQLF